MSKNAEETYGKGENRKLIFKRDGRTQWLKGKDNGKRVEEFPRALPVSNA